MVLRVRREDGSVQAHTWKAKDLSYLLRKARMALLVSKCSWTPEVDAYLLANYARHTKTQIAYALRKKFGGSYTKNAVISRYHTLRYRMKHGQR